MQTATARPEPATWLEEHQRQLNAAVQRVRAHLQRHLGEPSAPREAAPGADGCATLDTLVETFGLSSFERDLLLLCAGIELDAAFGPLCARLHGDPTRPYPTFGLALSALPEAHWSALSPEGPLRYWRLLELLPGPGLTQNRFRIDERILHFLTGVQHLDEHLLDLVTPLSRQAEPAPSQRATVAQIVQAWLEARPTPPLVQLIGDERHTVEAIAGSVGEALELAVYRLDVHLLPLAPGELSLFQRVWQREAVLSGCFLLLDTRDLESSDTIRQTAVRRLAEQMRTPLLISGRAPLRDVLRPSLTFEITKPLAVEQHDLWRQALGSRSGSLNGALEQLAGQFRLDAGSIQAAAWQAGEAGDETAQAARLWDACRLQARPRLDGLARRIVSGTSWNDLVLPEPELARLQEVAAHLRQRVTVHETWGFAHKSRRGLGLSALFAGPSGTGKTLAAEVLANELQLDLYHIDLSQVVSKYIGETEKNLARIFDAAESGGAILLFDEADALFGKRSEVKDSHDRYANIEISYLLQRMEAYRGLAILTTNTRQALDTAFLRRLRFIINFRFPDEGQRAAIWQRVFPPQTPTQGLKWERLAQLTVTGGHIRNIALNAAFYAAGAGQAVQMTHVLRAARAEYTKLDKVLSATETRGWLDGD